MKISNFATNENLEVNGVWRDIGQGAKLLIARENNIKFVEAVRATIEPYRSPLQRINIEEEKAIEMANELIAKYILLGWKNIEDDDQDPIFDWSNHPEGEPKYIPYSVENAVKLLFKFKEFKSLVLTLSKEVEQYRQQRVSDIVDNVKK